MYEVIIFDWGHTLYDTQAQALYPRALEVLERAHETHKLGLVTRSADPEAKLALLKELGVARFFSSIVAEPEKGGREFLRCLEELDVAPQEALIVDDHFSVGIVAGIELGCDTCWVRSGKPAQAQSEEGESATYEIDSIAELLELIGK